MIGKVGDQLPSCFFGFVIPAIQFRSIGHQYLTSRRPAVIVVAAPDGYQRPDGQRFRVEFFQPGLSVGLAMQETEPGGSVVRFIETLRDDMRSRRWGVACDVVIEFFGLVNQSYAVTVSRPVKNVARFSIPAVVTDGFAFALFAQQPILFFAASFREPNALVRRCSIGDVRDRLVVGGRLR